MWSDLRLCMVLCVTLLPLIQSHPNRGHNRVQQLFQRGLTYHESLEPTVCQSDECRTTGQKIKFSLDESVDPCDDFYEFSCGGWMKEHDLGDANQITSSSDMENFIINKLKEELGKESSKDDSKVVKFARDLYKSCVDIDTRESVGMAPIKSFMQSLGGWPLTGDHFDEQAFDWQILVPKILAKVSDALFMVDVSVDEKNNTLKRILFGPESRNLNGGIISSEEWDDQDKSILNARKQLILTSAIALGAKNDSQTEKEIQQILEFEYNLEKVLINLPDATNDIMSFDELNNISNHAVDWSQFANRIYAEINSTIRVSNDDSVEVIFPEYHDMIPKLLSKTPKRVVANYLGWAVADYLGQFATKDIGEAQLELATLRNLDTEREQWKECITFTSNYMTDAIARLYVDSSFSKDDKKKATLIVSDIKGSFDDIIRATDWLDTNTRDEAINKLKAIRQNIGYPEWILDNKILDDVYKLSQESNPKTYLANIFIMENHSHITRYNYLRTPVDKDSWPMAPYIVNAEYDPLDNSITIPAGILAPPHFDGPLPASVNYGTIGAIIGHELTHGFDTSGSEIDADGNERNWWTDSVRQEFNEKADCFRHEYSDVIDTQTGLHLIGNHTITEDIADNGGIQEAFRAYQKYVKREAKLERLPVIDKYSADQQFFIAYGYSLCAIYETKHKKELIEEEVHTINKYRVNLPLSNFDTFADVFKCGVNSQMNRKDKCVLW